MRLIRFGGFYLHLETFMEVVQRTVAGSNPRIPRVVSKSDIYSDHGAATTAHRTLGLMPAGTICCSNLSFSHCPIPCSFIMPTGA